MKEAKYVVEFVGVVRELRNNGYVVKIINEQFHVFKWDENPKDTTTSVYSTSKFKRLRAFSDGVFFGGYE